MIVLVQFDYLCLNKVAVEAVVVAVVGHYLHYLLVNYHRYYLLDSFVVVVVVVDVDFDGC